MGLYRVISQYSWAGKVNIAGTSLVMICYAIMAGNLSVV
jgi:hypothetical protein